MDDRELFSLAAKARENAYAPYSGFRVGAALLCADGTVYTGCNIESASYTPTVCAERTAFFKAVSEGKRDFLAIAIAGGKAGEAPGFCPPCGVCRQVMQEFCRPESFRILLSGERGEVLTFSLSRLLPFGFGPKNLKDDKTRAENKTGDDSNADG